MNKKNDHIESDLLDIIDLCREKEKSYKSLFEEKNSSVLEPLKENYEVLEHKLFLKLQSYDNALTQFAQTLEKASDSITPIKKHMHQLKTSSENVKNCLGVVESLISLHDSLSGIRNSLKEDNIEESCYHIHKALSSSPTLRKMRGQHQGELFEIQNQVFERLVKDLESSTDPKSILKYRKLFAIIGKKDEGIEIYGNYLSNHLRQDIEGVVNLNLQNCQLVPKKEEDSTYTDLLSEILDYCAASVEQHRRFVEEYYGRERFGVMVKKIGDVSQDSIETICRVCVQNVKKQTLTRKREISSLIDELAVIYDRTKRFRDWFDEMMMSPSEETTTESSSNSETPKKKKTKEESSVTIMKLFIELSEDFLSSSIQEIWETFVFKEKLLDLLNREDRFRVIELYTPSGDHTSPKRSQSSSHGSERGINEEEEEEEEDDDLSEEEEEEGEGGAKFNQFQMMGLGGDMDDSEEPSEVDRCSMVVDDFFFVLKRVIETGFLTSDTQIVCVFVNKIYDILSTRIQAYLARFHSHFYMNCVPPMEVAGSTNTVDFTFPFQLQGSKFPPAKSRKLFSNCFVSLNNIFQTSKYVTKFKKDVQRRCARYKNLVRLELIEATLHHLDTSSKDYHKLFEDFLESILRILEPYLQHMLDGVFSQTEYTLTEDVYDEYVKGNRVHWVQKLGERLDVFFQPYRSILLEEVFEVFVNQVVEVTLDRVKALVLQKKFSLFGGFQFDAEIRELMKYFGKFVTGSVRGKFTVIGQYAAILRADRKEDVNMFVNDYFQLPEEEMKKVQNLRVD